MNPVHPRFGPAFAATLALPTALAGTWAVLVHGGTIARAERTEAAAAAQCLAAADEALARGLAA
ncbi:MAG: hypothetical protein KDE27_31915, partial [Planctomycetes bacterium]|nr:hypothetical protein [Planctomycetota bacterium]